MKGLISITENVLYNLPINLPMKTNGKLNIKIVQKKDYTRKDGTQALYVQLFLNKELRRVPLNISVKPNHFSTNKERVTKANKNASDYNLLIEKILADINTIEVNYRLNSTVLTLDLLIKDLTNPSLRINFLSYAKCLIDYQNDKKIIKASTYRQQCASLKKIEGFKNPLFFSDINESLINEFRAYLKHSLKNKTNTIESTLKNFKKFLSAANKDGINTPLKYNEIKIRFVDTEITFLNDLEINKLYRFYNSEFINSSFKTVLQRYLFSCFTGIRFSDNMALTSESFLDNHLILTSQKTGKFQKIKLNNTAQSLITLPHVFQATFTDEHANRTLKEIARICGIKKNITFHTSRHTFATQYLISGGQLQNLKKILGHSKIETTMVYVHIVEALLSNEIIKMDNIIKD